MLYSSMDKIETFFLVRVVIPFALSHNLPKQTFYVAHNLYLSETAIIKASLLVQYLRIFKAGRMRWLCLGLLALVSMWGLAFSIMGWFSCKPVSTYWNRSADSKCYGFGYSDRASFVAMFQAHSATNMFFDLAIFAVPLPLFRTPNLKWKSILALSGLFTFGAV